MIGPVIAVDKVKQSIYYDPNNPYRPKNSNNNIVNNIVDDNKNIDNFGQTPHQLFTKPHKQRQITKSKITVYSQPSL